MRTAILTDPLQTGQDREKKVRKTIPHPGGRAIAGRKIRKIEIFHPCASAYAPQR